MPQVLANFRNATLAQSLFRGKDAIQPPSPQAADEISARCERERQCFSWQISLQAAGLLYCGCLTLHLSHIATQPAPRNNAATAIRPGGFSVWFSSVHLRKNQRAGRDAASSLSGRSSDTMVSAGEVADASTDRRTAEGRCCDDASAGRFAIVVRGAWSSASSESRSRLGAVCVPGTVHRYPP